MMLSGIGGSERAAPVADLHRELLEGRADRHRLDVAGARDDAGGGDETDEKHRRSSEHGDTSKPPLPTAGTGDCGGTMRAINCCSKASRANAATKTSQPANSWMKPSAAADP